MRLDLAHGPGAVTEALVAMLASHNLHAGADLVDALADAPPPIRAIARQRERRARFIADEEPQWLGGAAHPP